MGIELVVFDISGTTVADKGYAKKYIMQAIACAGIAGVDPVHVDDVMGYRKKDAIEILVARYKPGFESSPTFIELIHEDFHKRMIRHYETCEELVPLPFAENVFKELQKNEIMVALNTGFSRAVTNPILKRLGWDTAPFINGVICSDEVPEGRPFPYMIKSLMKKFNIKYVDEVAKVGDSKVDIDEGRNAGCGIIVGITTGANKRRDLEKCGADYVIDSLDALVPLIL